MSSESKSKNNGKKHNRSPSYDLPKKKFNPRDNLSEEQNEILNQFIEELEKGGLTPKERKFCDEACLCRYLRARDFNLQKALKMLRATLKWREEFKVEQIAAESLMDEAATGKVYKNGFDKNKRPIIYMTPGRENTKNYEKNIQLLVYTMERAIESMEDGVEQMVWIVDFNGYSRNNAPPLSVSLETLNIFSNHYPERLGVCFMVDTPWLFTFFWKAISPFINSNTYAKIIFASGDSEKQKQLTKFIDENSLEHRYSGKLKFTYDDTFWKTELEHDAKRLKKLGLHVAKEGSSEGEEKKVPMDSVAVSDSPVTI